MLNKAHLLHRQAEKASRKGRVEEAIQLHKEAADILRDLLQTIINDKVWINLLCTPCTKFLRYCKISSRKISTSYSSIPQVAESVRLQAELHEKEKLILRQQRQRCKKVYKDLESLRTKMSDAQGKWKSEDLKHYKTRVIMCIHLINHFLIVLQWLYLWFRCRTRLTASTSTAFR